MQFNSERRSIILRGDPSLARSKISLKAIFKMIRKEGGGMLIELNALEARTEESGGGECESSLVKGIIDEFQAVFEIPPGCHGGETRSTKSFSEKGATR